MRASGAVGVSRTYSSSDPLISPSLISRGIVSVKAASVWGEEPFPLTTRLGAGTQYSLLKHFYSHCAKARTEGSINKHSGLFLAEELWAPATSVTT